MIGTIRNVPVQDGALHPPAAGLSRESGEVDEAFARVAGEIAEKEAISVERMRVEMANFVDDVGPEVRRRIREMLAEEDRELSLSSLVQLQRVVLDTVKFLDRGEGNEEPVGFTDEEWEKLLGEELFEEDS
jgi:hypothetical protein